MRVYRWLGPFASGGVPEHLQAENEERCTPLKWTPSIPRVEGSLPLLEICAFVPGQLSLKSNWKIPKTVAPLEMKRFVSKSGNSRNGGCFPFYDRNKRTLKCAQMERDWKLLFSWIDRNTSPSEWAKSPPQMEVAFSSHQHGTGTAFGRSVPSWDQFLSGRKGNVSRNRASKKRGVGF